MVEPLQLLRLWEVSISALNGSKYEDALLAAGYATIRGGPGLALGPRSLAASIELLDADFFEPYFLGHAYVRALHRRIARSALTFRSGETFFALMMRVLRSATRRLLTQRPRWDQPSGANCIYNWLDIVSRAPAARLAQLVDQDDRVDVLQFLESGIERAGYDGTSTAIIEEMRTLLPEQWQTLGSIVESAFPAIAAAKGDSLPQTDVTVKGVVDAWLQGTTILNLSTDGVVHVRGLFDHRLDGRAALALDVDGHGWCLAGTDEDMRRLCGDAAGLARLTSADIDGDQDCAAGALAPDGLLRVTAAVAGPGAR